jgi:hypothetical protein
LIHLNAAVQEGSNLIDLHEADNAAAVESPAPPTPP